jgi:glycosyltransferase involved in cell wall biosynthesis
MTVYPSFAVLVPTRNRPSQLKKLLESLLMSTLKPSQIIIVASGEDIGHLLEIFAKKLPITYLHTEVIGQVNQKKEGLGFLDEKLDWVVFLDDDLLVHPEAFANAFSTLLEQDTVNSRPIIGIGLKISSTTRTNDLSKFGHLLSKLFLLSSATPGLVLKSGQAISYLDETTPFRTEWLNGASIWRRDSAIAYRNLTSSSKYAAYEDVMYSYPQSKIGDLIFSPKSIVVFQENSVTNFEAKDVYECAAYLRMFFVLNNSDLNPILCAWSQVGRSFFAAKQIGFFNLKYLLFLSQINWRLFLVAMKLKRIKSLLDKIST